MRFKGLIMDSMERVIGRLEEHHKATNDRLAKIEEKIDLLQEFRWRVAGGAFALSFVVSSLFSVGEFVLNHYSGN
jgi:hypothetical protein